MLGFAFKKDTGDTRESPAIQICKVLLEEHAKVRPVQPLPTVASQYTSQYTRRSSTSRVSYRQPSFHYVLASTSCPRRRPQASSAWLCVRLLHVGVTRRRLQVCVYDPKVSEKQARQDLGEVHSGMIWSASAYAARLPCPALAAHTAAVCIPEAAARAPIESQSHTRVTANV